MAKCNQMKKIREGLIKQSILSFCCLFFFLFLGGLHCPFSIPFFSRQTNALTWTDFFSFFFNALSTLLLLGFSCIRARRIIALKFVSQHLSAYYISSLPLFSCVFFFELFGGSIPTSSADASENTKAAIYCQLLCCTPYRYIFKPFHLHTCGWVPRADTVADVYTFWRGAVDGKHTLMWGGGNWERGSSRHL